MPVIETDGTPAGLYSKGNELFVSEDYGRAIELYSEALALNSSLAECYVARAHAYIKTDQFEAAKKDADRGIDLLRSNNDTSGAAAKAFLRSGVATFHLGRYKEAKNIFQEGQKLEDEPGLRQWLAWCDEKIQKFGDSAGSKTNASSSESAECEEKSAVGAVEKEEDSAAPQEQEQEQAIPMPVPKIKHDWYQTETHVIVEVRIKNLKNEDVSVNIDDTALSVTAKLPTGSDYSLELDLAHPVVPAQSSHRVLGTKIEIKVRKGEGVRWNNLEGDGATPAAGAQPLASAPAGALKAPYASGRDWNAIEKNLAKEAEDKAEGEAALNEMFQKIYADASDEVKMAMNKSFQESGGTVLSTNWNEVGKEKVEIKPPDGMEWKKWDNV